MTPDLMRKRTRDLQAKLREHQLDGMLVIKPENVRYLSGFYGYSTRTEYAMPRRLIAMVVPANGDCALIVPKIEHLYARRQTWVNDVRVHVEWGEAGVAFGGLALLNTVLREKGLSTGRLALETGFVSARLHSLLRDDLSRARLVDAPPILEEMRMIKSPEEIEVLRISGTMAVKEFEAEAQGVRAGVREFELAEIGRREGSRLYAEHLSRHPTHAHHLASPLTDGLQIITSGERLDMVHALASAREIEPGDMVLLDFCRYPQFLGYRIGFSRMASLRQPTKTEQEMYRLTMEAFRLSLSVLKPGVMAEEPDLIARQFLDKHGLGETFVHRTGRGVGLEGVERPEIGAGDKTLLQPGMVVTVEPSIYFPEFAVHVEDTFLITDNGYEVLTPCPRELRVIPG
jgi:Xaa-Pro aminopeptidase